MSELEVTMDTTNAMHSGKTCQTYLLFSWQSLCRFSVKQVILDGNMIVGMSCNIHIFPVFRTSCFMPLLAGLSLCKSYGLTVSSDRHTSPYKKVFKEQFSKYVKSQYKFVYLIILDIMFHIVSVTHQQVCQFYWRKIEHITLSFKLQARCVSLMIMAWLMTSDSWLWPGQA